MKDLRQLIETKLASTDSPDPFMDTVKDVLIKIAEYQEQFLEEVRLNIASSYDSTGSTDVFTTLIEKTQLQKYNNIFFPIVDPSRLRDTEILRNIKKQIAFKFDTCYVHLGYDALKEWIEKDCRFEGKLIDKNGTEYAFNFKLYKNYDYEKIEEELYHVFYKNNIEWRTINSPYIRKMFDIIICDHMDDTSSIEEIHRIELNFGDLEKYIYREYIPVWNIEIREELCLQKRPKVLPLEEKNYYKYDLSIENDGEETVLLDSEDIEIEGITREGDQLTVLTLEEANRSYWKLYSFKPINSLRDISRDIKHPIFSNHQRPYSSHKNTFKYFLKTAAEIKGIVVSHDDLKEWNILDLQVLDDYEGGIYGEDYNVFIKNRLIPYDLRKIILIVFDVKEKNEFTYDLLHFIFSQLQLIFPEYRWRGELK
ncbi:hypothetical protein [Clostridium formicaceticum]|uniref:Normocyte-binding protein n=1 Tax=Clostridium formicaceticum TaxID=1497 RepID=A0ABN4T515_9CLOT|nr:hypothetical protein [Clostridium formicaceticum]AOY74679.1 hypothetical protein BJL90_01140 [Clostridium formicaceticum]